MGSYSEYREYIKDYEAGQRSLARAEEKAAKEKAAKEVSMTSASPAKKKKLSYKEQKELEQIEKDLERLSVEKNELEALLSSGSLSFDKLQSASERIGCIISECDVLEMRWLELNEDF